MAYEGRIDVDMVFDFEPGKKHQYERVTIIKREGAHLWCYGRAGMTFHEEHEFRQHVVHVADRQEAKPRPQPAPLVKRYEGPIAVGMAFDFEPGKKHQYERLTITEKKGANLWCYGRSGMTYYQEQDFREHVVPASGA